MSSWPQHFRDEPSWITGTCLRAGSISCPSRGWVITSVREILALQDLYLMFFKSQSICNLEVFSASTTLVVTRNPSSSSVWGFTQPFCSILLESPLVDFFPVIFLFADAHLQGLCSWIRALSCSGPRCFGFTSCGERGNVSVLQPLKSESAPIGITPPPSACTEVCFTLYLFANNYWGTVKHCVSDSEMQTLRWPFHLEQQHPFAYNL